MGRPQALAGRGAALALLAVLIAACAGPTYVDRSAGTRPALALEPVTFEVTPAWRERPPRCVAILPLSWDGAPQAEQAPAAAVRRALYAHLSPRPLADVELARIDRALARMAASDRRDTRRLGERLGCDALMIGTVTQYGTTFLGLYSKVAVGVELELVRATDGTVLWSGRHVARSHGGEVPTGVVDVLTGIASAIANLGGEQLARVTDDLARRLVSTIPEAVPAVAHGREAGPQPLVASAGVARD